jgi:hypothetical protein
VRGGRLQGEGCVCQARLGAHPPCEAAARHRRLTAGCARRRIRGCRHARRGRTWVGLAGGATGPRPADRRSLPQPVAASARLLSICTPGSMLGVPLRAQCRLSHHGRPCVRLPPPVTRLHSRAAPAKQWVPSDAPPFHHCKYVHPSFQRPKGASKGIATLCWRARPSPKWAGVRGGTRKGHVILRVVDARDNSPTRPPTGTGHKARKPQRPSRHHLGCVTREAAPSAAWSLARRAAAAAPKAAASGASL